MSETGSGDKHWRKKPVVIEAMQFTECNRDEVMAWCGSTGDALSYRRSVLGFIVPTLEGQHIAMLDDYIIKGVKGEFYPCKPDIFAATYEPASTASASVPSERAAGVREGLKDLHHDLGAITWTIGADAGWDFAIASVRSEIAKRIQTGSPGNGQAPSTAGGQAHQEASSGVVDSSTDGRLKDRYDNGSYNPVPPATTNAAPQASQEIGTASVNWNKPAEAAPSHELPSERQPSTQWKFWREAEPMALEPYYCYWVSHLTSEGLHDKADIATVLAILHQQRDDMQNDALRLHREKMDALFGPDGKPRSSTPPSQPAEGPTPETDAHQAEFHSFGGLSGNKPALMVYDHARTLERQRDEARRGLLQAIADLADLQASRSARLPSKSALKGALLHSMLQLRVLNEGGVGELDTVKNGLIRGEAWVQERLTEYGLTREELAADLQAVYDCAEPKNG